MQNIRLSSQLELVGVAASSPAGREGLPLYLSPVKAGFPSPAEDYVDRKLDLHEYLVHNRAATFFLRAQGDSMLGAGIHDGDLLIVDRSVADRVVFMADGQILEVGTPEELFDNPQHPRLQQFLKQVL